jgi:hypothetical protein
MKRTGILARLAAPGLLGLGVVAMFAVLPARSQEPVRGKKYALLVAVDRYERGSLLPGLPFPRRDIEGLEKVFLDAGYDKASTMPATGPRPSGTARGAGAGTRPRGNSSWTRSIPGRIPVSSRPTSTRWST